jgi:hypothetical protein
MDHVPAAEIGVQGVYCPFRELRQARLPLGVLLGYFLSAISRNVPELAGMMISRKFPLNGTTGILPEAQSISKNKLF